MTPNRTNHPPRKGIEIEKHKGGRTARLGARFTEAEKAAIMAAAHAVGLSVSDFILTHPALAQLTPGAADLATANATEEESRNDALGKLLRGLSSPNR